MMKKRMMTAFISLVLVFAMSLSSFAALRGQTTTMVVDGVTFKQTRTIKVLPEDFERLLNVCNEKYGEGSGIVKKVQAADGKIEGTAEPVGSDRTNPDEGIQRPLPERQYTGRTVEIKHLVYGPNLDPLTGKPVIERIDTETVKLTSMHDYVSKGNSIRFVNGKRLSDTEFVLRVDCDAQDTDAKTSQSFRGDYYVSVIPYTVREIGRNARGEMETEAVIVPDEFATDSVPGLGGPYNNKVYGPAWFFCMLFDTTQPKGKREIIGYLVAQRITRWPDWNDRSFYRSPANPVVKLDGRRVNPTAIARESATVYKVDAKGEFIFDRFGNRVVDYTTFVDVAAKYPYISYEYEVGSSKEWFANMLTNANW